MHALLELASPSVETLTIVSRTSRATFASDHLCLDALRFPNLKELTLRGCYSMPLQASFAPALARLHVSGDVLHSPFARLIPKFYPRLTHLRISRLEFIPHIDDILRSLCCLMSIRPRSRHGSPTEDGRDRPVLAASNRYILVEPGPGHWIGPGGRAVLASPTERHLLGHLLSEESERLTLLPQYAGYGENEAVYAKTQWIDRFNGGRGCWTSLNSEKVLR